MFQPIVHIASRAPKPSNPADMECRHPRQDKSKSAFGLRQLDHDEPNALLAGGLGRLVAGVALIDKCHFYGPKIGEQSAPVRHWGHALARWPT